MPQGTNPTSPTARWSKPTERRRNKPHAENENISLAKANGWLVKQRRTRLERSPHRDQYPSSTSKWAINVSILPYCSTSLSIGKAAHLYHTETADWAMIQARRWLQNERRKLDTGGLTPDGIAGFVKWTRQGDGYEWAPSEQCEDTNVAIKRFLDEMKAARQARNKTSNMKDWWKVEPPHPASARRKWARENIGRSKAKEGAESGADGSGGPPMGMDVDQTGHELAAGGVRDGSELLDPVSADAFGVPAHEGKHAQGHTGDNDNDTMPKQLKLALRLGKPKIGEAGKHNIHDVGPESVTCQASDKVEGSDSDIDDMAPEPVLRADYEEDENTM